MNMLDDRVESFLEKLDAESIAKEISEEMKSLVEALHDKIGDLEEELADANSIELQEAADRFLDCVDRPCGTREFNIPKSGERDRALIALFDAVGRSTLS